MRLFIQWRVFRREMNLLVYSHVHNLRNGTGTGRFASEVIQGLAGYGPDSVAVIGEALEIDRQNFSADRAWENVTFKGFDRGFRQQQLLWATLGHPLIEMHWPNADLVYSPAEAFVATRKPFVVTIHDLAYFDHGAHTSSFSVAKQRWKWKLLFRRLAARADLFHTVSSFSAERLANFFPDMAGRIRVVPNGVSEFFFDQQQDEPRGRYIHVPGGLHFRKNADLIIEAWRLFAESNRDISLVITGSNVSSYAKKAADFGDRVQLLGYVDDLKLRRIYRQASVVWFPSRYEGFGIPVLEAMACGAPVLTSTAAALPEVAGDAALLRSPDDPAAHARALREIVEDVGLAKQLSARGRVRAQKFRWSDTVSGLRTLFDEVIK